MIPALTHKRKVMGLAVLSVVLPVIVILALMVKFEGTVSGKATTELDRLAKVNAGQIARDVYGICEVSHDLIQQKINHDLIIAREMLVKKGGIKTGPRMVRWDAANQFTGQTRTVVLPGFAVGGTWLKKNENPRADTPVVDEISRLAGGTCTIFQRMNEAGDMLRVASNTLGADRKRTIGTYIPALNPDGAPNPVVESVLNGRTYRCPAYLMNSWYLTAYEPIRNKKEEIIGMLCIGEKLEAVASLRKTIANMQVGKNGEVGIIGAKGKNQGRYIISRDNARDGQDIWNARDDSDRPYVQSMIRKALNQAAGTVAYETYFLGNPKDSRMHKKITAAMYFPPYEWMIFATASQEDYYSSVHRVGDSIRGLLMEIIVVVLCFLVLAIVLAMLLGKEMTKFFQFMTNVAKNIATGDLRKARQDLAAEFKKRGRTKSSRNEIEELLGAFNVMTNRLDSSFRRLGRATARVNNSVTEKVPAVQGVSKTVHTPVSEPEKMTPAAQEMVRDIGKVAVDLGRTIGAAESSRSDLAAVESNMRELSGMTGRISSGLTAIDSQANQISKGITVMTAVADQANLLALNASITAEKAGKLGRGFTLVAREAGRLSNQTEAAAQNIDGIVREIRATTTAGLADIDALGETVQKTATGVAAVRERLDVVVDHLQSCDLRLDGVRKGLDDRSGGEADRTGEAMGRLSEVSRRTRESIRNFQQAMDQLNQHIEGLQVEVSGRGFPVIAREIRYMAEQMINAATDIDASVIAMQTAFSRGSRGNDKVGDEIRKKTDRAVALCGQLNGVIDQILVYDCRPDSVEDGGDDHSVAAKRLSDAVTHLSALFLQVRESVEAFGSTTERIIDAVDGSGEISGSMTGAVPDK